MCSWGISSIWPFLLVHFSFTVGLHISGKWESASFFTILAKFGVQQTDDLHQLHSQGYIYGNITSASDRGRTEMNCSSLGDENHPEVYLLLTDLKLIQQIVEIRGGEEGSSCERIMSVLKPFAFHSKCSPTAPQDFIRRLPCPSDHLCCDEDEPKNLVKNFQFTYNIRDTKQPRFWFLSLLSCHPNSSCAWMAQRQSLALSYDIWLVNGSPLLRYQNPFEHQFSFDKQDTPEIYLVAMLLVSVLLVVQCHSHFGLFNSRKGLLLFVTLSFSEFSVLCHTVHSIVFSFDGVGAEWLSVAGGIAFVTAENLFLLNLILVASGWSVTKSAVVSSLLQRILALWVGILILHLILYFLNESVIAKTTGDSTKSWAEWSFVLLRVLATSWFVLLLKKSIRRELDDDKAAFLRSFGIGFLIWFAFVPVFSVISTWIPLLWRYKVSLSLTLLADYLAMAMAVHLFWPRSSYSRYFYRNPNLAEDLEDFELSIMMEEIEEVERPKTHRKPNVVGSPKASLKPK